MFLLKLSFLRLSFGQSLSLLTCFLLQARDSSCSTKPRESSEVQIWKTKQKLTPKDVNHLCLLCHCKLIHNPGFWFLTLSLMCAHTDLSSVNKRCESINKQYCTYCSSWQCYDKLHCNIYNTFHVLIHCWLFYDSHWNWLVLILKNNWVLWRWRRLLFQKEKKLRIF